MLLTILPVAVILPVVDMSPLAFKLSNVPTVVKLELTTLFDNVLPVILVAVMLALTFVKLAPSPIK